MSELNHPKLCTLDCIDRIHSYPKGTISSVCVESVNDIRVCSFVLCSATAAVKSSLEMRLLVKCSLMLDRLVDINKFH